MTAIGRRGIWERSASSDRSPSEEHRRAANGYLAWPFALANLVREDQDETNWTQIHARQALVLGLLWSVGYVCLLAIPLIIVIAIPGISAGATIAIYGVALVVDLLVALAIVLIGVRYASKAARGQLFSIPVVTPIVDRWLRRKQR